MKLKIVSLFIFILVVMSINAQKMGYAVNISTAAKNLNAENKLFYDQMLIDIEVKGLKEFVVYDWSKNTLSPRSQDSVKPCEKAIFTSIDVNHTDRYKPKIVTKYDTNGYIIKAWFEIDYKAGYLLRLVDVPTGIVEDVQYNNIKEITATHKYPTEGVGIAAKYLKTKSFSTKKIKFLYKTYKKDIEKRFVSLRNFNLGGVKNVVYKLNGIVDREIFSVSIPDINADKIQEVIVHAGLDRNVKGKSTFNIYALNEVEGKKFVEEVTFVTVEKVEADRSVCGKSWVQSRKKWTKRLKKFDKLYAIRNPSLIREISPIAKSDLVNISISEKTSKRAKARIEISILKVAKIQLIERELEKELDVLRAMYKDERFMDYDLKGFQDKQIGVKYLMSFEDDNINITDVETGKMLSVDSNEGKRNWFFSGYSKSQAMKMSLFKISGYSIELLKVLKEKKKKIKRIQVYHPFGFEGGDKLDISVVIEETIGGKVFKRKEFIAKGWVVVDKDSPNIGKIKINRKGRKAMYKAVKGDAELFFQYSIKRD